MSPDQSTRVTHELVYQPHLPALKFGRRLHPDLRELPSGYTVVRNPETKIRHIRTPNGYLLSNEGFGFRNPKRPSDWELWEVLRYELRRGGVALRSIQGDQHVEVECKFSRAGNPCVLRFRRFNDENENISVDCDKDPALTIYLRRLNNSKYVAEWSRRRADGGPITGSYGRDFPTQHAAFVAAMKQSWG